MVIGIDGNEANLEHRVGVNQYAFEILTALSKLPESRKHRFFVYLKEKPRADLPKERINWKYKVLPGGGKWIIKSLMSHLYKKTEGLDVFFSPSHYVPLSSPVPRVCTITDLGYLSSRNQFKTYDYWQLTLWTAWSILVCRKVIAISEATKKDIINHYPFSESKTEAVLLAGDSSVLNANISGSDVAKIKKKYSLGDKYVLFLSTLKPSKNVLGLLSAWAEVYQKHESFKLIIAGKKGWLYSPIFEHVKKLGIEESVVFTDFVPDSDKPALMKGAYAFILPSFWEGFGIDIVNSMALGVPVVSSDRGSIPEVAGEVGILVDPEKVGDIASAIHKVLSLSKKEYNKLSQKCKEQAKKFSWEKTARETLKIITNI